MGLSLIVVLGPERFQQFLEGFHAIDEYFCNHPLENNAVALMGLLNVWYVNFFGSKSHAVLPYCQYLHRFPAYLLSSSPWSPTASTSAGTAAP